MNLLPLQRIISQALEEDIGLGDITTEAVVPQGAWASAKILARQPGVLCGIDVARAVFLTLSADIAFTAPRGDGDKLGVNDLAAQIEGDARAILMGERTALNLLQRLSGIATTTFRYVAACEGTKARIVDTRKTAPGLRMLDKYAVRVGAGFNHRVGLYDGVLIKENHIRAGGGITRAVEAARTRAPHTVRVEVECENLEQVLEAIHAGAEIILLDNMSTVDLKRAVDLVAGRALVEASGNMTLPRIPEVAATGVDLISVGALTHSVTALDLSLQITGWRIPGELSV